MIEKHYLPYYSKKQIKLNSQNYKLILKLFIYKDTVTWTSTKYE